MSQDISVSSRHTNKWHSYAFVVTGTPIVAEGVRLHWSMSEMAGARRDPARFLRLAGRPPGRGRRPLGAPHRPGRIIAPLVVAIQPRGRPRGQGW